MRLLHVVNGDATTEKLRAAGIAGTVMTYPDVLHEGPVPPDDDVEEFLEVRARVIEGFGWGTREEILELMRTQQRQLEAFEAFDEVVLWYEHDLFDQLLLVRLLAWWWNFGRARPPQLVSPPDYLGAMAPEQLLEFFANRERVSGARMELADRAWRAITAAQPIALCELMDAETSVLPHLRSAIIRLLEEYPSTFNGVGRTERQVLDILAQSPLSALDLFAANARREERVFMGDTTFFARIAGLMRARRPLVEGDLNSGSLRLTAHGQAVQTGEADNVALNGIDKWIGGVHVTERNLWRWNGHACVQA